MFGQRRSPSLTRHLFGQVLSLALPGLQAMALGPGRGGNLQAHVTGNGAWLS